MNGHAAWALGVSRGALDDVVELAIEKTRMGEESSIAHKLTFQRDLAHHEGMWRAAHRLVVDTYTQLESRLEAGEALSPTMRADMRIAATYAPEARREIVQFTHLAAGPPAIRAGNRLARAFRDLYTGTHTCFSQRKNLHRGRQVNAGPHRRQPGVVSVVNCTRYSGTG